MNAIKYKRLANSPSSGSVAGTITGTLTPDYYPVATGASTLGDGDIYKYAGGIKITNGKAFTSADNTAILKLSNSGIVEIAADNLAYGQGSLYISPGEATMAFGTTKGFSVQNTEAYMLWSGTKVIQATAGALTLNHGTLISITGTTRFNNLTATTVPYLDASKNLTSSAITPTQLGYLSPATGNTGTGNLVFGTGPTLTDPIVGTQLSTDNSTKAASTAFVNQNALPNDMLVRTALGSTIIASTIPLTQVTSALNMADGRVYFAAVYIRTSQTITGVKWLQDTQGNYTADNYNGVGLYSYSGGTLTLVASSTDDGNIWKGASGTIQSKAFSSTYAATAGLYFVACVYNSSAQVTAPAFETGAVLRGGEVNTADLTNSAKFFCFVAGTTLPSPTQAISGLGSMSNPIFLSVY